MIVVVGSNKGGVAKTTTVANLAVALNLRGKSVCVVDADPQRSIAEWNQFREEGKLTPAINLIEKRDNISQTLQEMNKHYDIVLVDVAGRNSKEFLTGGVVSDLIIAPHRCSQLDLNTLNELQLQVDNMRNFNPNLKVYIYQTVASTGFQELKERQDFEQVCSDYPEFELLNARSHHRKVYIDVMSEGKSVVEADNVKAIEEVNDLIDEIGLA